MRACWILGLALACGGDNRAEPPEPSPPVETPVAESPAPQTPVVPATIRVLNDTDETHVLDLSFGRAAPLGVVRLGPGMERPLSLDPGDAASEWETTCECECSASACADCEPPEPVSETLAPNESYLFAWNGQLRRRHQHRNGGPCWTTILTQPGDYVLTACTEAGVCARAEVTLPAREIEIRLSQRASAESCDAFDAAHTWAIRGRVIDQLSHALRDRPLDQCTRVTCVAPAELERELVGARSEPCTVFIIPRGTEVEARAFLPLPEGTHGGESYAQFYDPDFTRFLRARYEQ